MLEVVISIGLLVMGLSVLGAQINRARESAHAGEDLTRLIMLAESKIAELETGLVHFEADADDEVEGDFSLRFPHYGWRMRIEETATEDLWALTLEILHAPRESLDDELDLDNAEVVYQVHMLRATPAVLDVETDLGLDEETINELTEKLPPEFFDPPNFDPSMVTQLDMEDLIELLPALMSLFGDNADVLLASLPPTFRAMLDLEGVGVGTGEAGEAEDEATFDGSVELTDEELRMFENMGADGGTP